MAAVKDRKPTRHARNESDESLFLSPARCATLLNVTERWIWRALNDGRLRKSHVGKFVRVHRDDLASFAEKQRGA